MKYTFSHEKFSLDVAQTHQEMAQKLKDNHYHIILLDFEFDPTMNGYELAAHINTESNNSNIIMIFASFDTIDETQLKMANVKDRISKPFDSQQLVDICEKVIQRATAAASSALPPSATPAPLKEQATDWAFEVPGVIGQEEQQHRPGPTTENIPPVIEQNQQKEDEEGQEDQQDQEQELGLTLEPPSPDPQDFLNLEELAQQAVQSDLEESLPDQTDDMLKKLRPMIEQNVEKHCQRIIERVAWEIIPELAENIIKKEIAEIKKAQEKTT